MQLLNMKLINLIKQNKESEEDFDARSLWVNDSKDKYVLVWKSDIEMKSGRKKPKKMSWSEAQAYYLTLESRPSGPICKYYTAGKLCDMCGGYNGDCKGMNRENGGNENE